MRKAHVNVVSLAIFSWALIETDDDKWDFGWLDEIVELLHSSGIKICLATATASPPPWLTKKHPEILPVTKNGETLHPGGRQHWRATSPVFRRYALRLVEKLAERYGKHPAVVAWHVNNELGCHNSVDYSSDAEVAFRVWLQKRYETVEKLNEAWGTAFWSQHYNDFDTILPPKQAATFPNPGQQLDWTRFSSDILGEYLDAETEILHRLSSVPVTTNYMLGSGSRALNVVDWKVDFVSNDHYRQDAKPHSIDELSFSASLTSGVAESNPWWLMEHSTSAVNWQPVNRIKSPGELARDSLTHVAHGADAVCFFQWRQSRAGAEKYHSSMVPHAGEQSRLFQDVCGLGKTLKNLAEIRGSKRVRGDVAILFDWDSWWASELDSHPSSLIDYYRQALDWYVALLDAGMRVDVIPARSNFESYSQVFAPTLYMVDSKLEERIKRYVEKGGHLVTTFFSGIVDENDHVKLGGYPGASRDLLGVRVEEFSPLFADAKVELEEGIDGALWSEQVDVQHGTESIIRYKSGSPAITRKKHGEGSAVYVSTSLGVEGINKVLNRILQVKSALPKQLVGKVEYVIRASKGQQWAFVFNRSGGEFEIENIPGELVAGSNTLGPAGFAVLKRQD